MPAMESECEEVDMMKRKEETAKEDANEL